MHLTRCGRGLLLNSPILFKIPVPNPIRLPSNIPLRTLPAHDERDLPHDRQQSSWLLPSSQHGHGYPADEPAYAGSEDGSDESSWTDTGDIAEQLDEDDPLRDRVNETLDDEALAGVLKRRANPHKKRVRYQEPLSPGSSRSPSRRADSIDKEAIRIPEVVRRKASKGERLIAAIMTGGSSSIHGLTGKPLLWVLARRCVLGSKTSLTEAHSYFTSVFVSLGVFLFGYDQGVMSGIITYVSGFLPSYCNC